MQHELCCIDVISRSRRTWQTNTLYPTHTYLCRATSERSVPTRVATCNQWLSLAKTLLKVTLTGGNRSLVARTSKCGWANLLHKEVFNSGCPPRWVADMGPTLRVFGTEEPARTAGPVWWAPHAQGGVCVPFAYYQFVRWSGGWSIGFNKRTDDRSHPHRSS